MVDASRPNVVLAVVDAARADHVSGYPGGSDATPNLGAFADEATVFERAITPAPWTLPSVTSLLTGLDPTEHGATSRGFEPDGGSTLQRDLSAAGYRTIHVSPKTWIGDWLPQGRGFDRIREFTGPTHRYFEDGTDVRRLSEGVARGWSWYATVARRALASERPLQSLGNAAAYVVSESTGDAWLDDADASRRGAELVGRQLARAVEDEQPFFCLVHLMDPHLPFYVPERFRTDDVRPPDCESFADEVAWMRELMDDIWRVRNGDRRLDADEQAYLRTRYRDELATADAALGRILDELEELGLAEETLVAVTADHGEHLGERVDGRTMLDHQASVRLPVLHVPLMLRLPGTFEAQRRSELVQPHDLAPTIRALAGLDHDETRRLDKAVDDRVASTVYDGVVPWHPPEDQRTAFLARSRASAIVGEWKVDVSSDEGRPAAEAIEDVDRAVRIDWATGERTEVRPEAIPAEARARLETELGRLASTRASQGGPTLEEMSSDARQRLRQLGYLG